MGLPRERTHDCVLRAINTRSCGDSSFSYWVLVAVYPRSKTEFGDNQRQQQKIYSPSIPCSITHSPYPQRNNLIISSRSSLDPSSQTAEFSNPSERAMNIPYDGKVDAAIIIRNASLSSSSSSDYFVYEGIGGSQYG